MCEPDCVKAVLDGNKNFDEGLPVDKMASHVDYKLLAKNSRDAKI